MRREIWVLRRFLSIFRSILIMAARRLGSEPGLMACLALGLFVAVALAMSIPLYADGVQQRLLTNSLSETILLEDEGRTHKRPPFAFLFRGGGGWSRVVERKEYEAANQFFAERAAALLGLPVQLRVRYVRTEDLALHPTEGSAYQDPGQSLGRVSLGFVDGLAEHVRLVEGSFPGPHDLPGGEGAGDGDSVEVLVSEAKANAIGLMVGERFILMSDGLFSADRVQQIPVRVAGLWRPVNRHHPFWLYAPESFTDVFLTREDLVFSRALPAEHSRLGLAVWYFVFDGRGVHTPDVPLLLGRITTVQTMASMLLSDVALDVSPVEALTSFQRAVNLLTILLAVFAIPIVGLTVYFIVLIANLVVQRQRNEIAVLRARGASGLQIVGLYLLERLILGAIALATGAVLGPAVARAIGQTRSFLVFGLGEGLAIRLSWPSVTLGLGAVVISVLASLLPALAATRHTIITYKQLTARSAEGPWWQRLYLDFLLLIVPLYGYLMLRQRGTISLLGRDVAPAADDPFRNPLLFLVPTLFVFAMALIVIRVVPLLLALVARLVQPLAGISLLLALRQLERAWGHYAGPMLLIILTLSLACFTASMALTLDRNLADRTYYDVGADVRLVEAGDRTLPDPDRSGGASAGRSSGSGKETSYWTFLPVSEHLRVSGVLQAARIAYFPTQVRLGDRTVIGKVVGIDRSEFPRVAFFRRDFARDSLGALMNLLASNNRAAVASTALLAAQGLSVGDAVNLRVGTDVGMFDVPLTIVGSTDLFSTLYPDATPFFVANLTYLFDRMGGQQPYDVLLRTAPSTDTRAVVTGLEQLGLRVVKTYDARGKMDGERLRPERQGILGLLSVGFLASTLLTALGFLLYSFLSFRRRSIELGMLRTIGLSVAQMRMLLSFEQLTLIATGVAAGTGLGVLSSLLFIPFLQVQSGSNPRIPPFVVQIAWVDILRIYAIFTAILLLAVAGLSWLLARMRIAEAVKLGDTT
ncbi:MAG: ABC transporter permease [Chloroflexi bacterium]|nr:ABC transporter permease [Chloroflexota bacterium]